MDNQVQTPRGAGMPGALRHEVRIRLHTRQAQALIEGRTFESGQRPIIGLQGFGRYITQIWRSAQYDDPYADWALLRIEEELARAHKLIRPKTLEIARVLESMPAVEIELAASVDPIQVPVMFANTYGFLGAYLLADYDELVRTLLTARRVGLMDRDQAWRVLLAAGRAVRRTFNLPVTAWRYTGVTRANVQAHDALAQRVEAVYAAAKMIAPPAEVLQGIRRGKHAPATRKASEESVKSARRYLEEVGDDGQGNT
jgi:integrating conjugative element protein (TIGR03761 family)